MNPNHLQYFLGVAWGGRRLIKSPWDLPCFNWFKPGGLWTSLTQQLQRSADARVTFVWEKQHMKDPPSVFLSCCSDWHLLFYVRFFPFRLSAVVGFRTYRRTTRPKLDLRPGVFFRGRDWTPGKKPRLGWGDCVSDCCWRCSSHVNLGLVQCPAAGLLRAPRIWRNVKNSICPWSMYLIIYQISIIIIYNSNYFIYYKILWWYYKYYDCIIYILWLWFMPTSLLCLYVNLYPSHIVYLYYANIVNP